VRKLAPGRAHHLHTLSFQPLTFDLTFAGLSASPFGHRSNFGVFRRALEQLPATTYTLSGDMNGLDVSFADHSDRFRAFRRYLFTNKSWRRAF
jgi:hypothetical protein